jgi:glycosyltransferase involved in cell wall biosynthesis
VNGIAVVTYNRGFQLADILEAVESTAPPECRLVVADDGSNDETATVVRKHPKWILVTGPNLGVAANKNRGLFALQDCAYISLIEDDLKPIKSGWFDMYRQVALYTGIHHFCRVQNKRVKEVIPEFTKDLLDHNVQPIYGPAPRGDFTFITRMVLDKVGGLNPKFRGVGYAHGEWSDRVVKAGLIPHPLNWIDLRAEGEDHFEQLGDMEGGRWNVPKEEIKAQLLVNKKIRNELEATSELKCPLILE